eukprot:3458861-Rhodomonas_salina.2
MVGRRRPGCRHDVHERPAVACDAVPRARLCLRQPGTTANTFSVDARPLAALTGGPACGAGSALGTHAVYGGPARCALTLGSGGRDSRC